MGASVPFCAQCKAIVYPKEGRLVCRRCGWSGDGETAPRVISRSAEPKKQVILEDTTDARPVHDAECPKCGHGRAHFHLMQTRRSDEPPTTINQCVECGHSWRKY